MVQARALLGGIVPEVLYPYTSAHGALGGECPPYFAQYRSGISPFPAGSGFWSGAIGWNSAFVGEDALLAAVARQPVVARQRPQPAPSPLTLMCF